MDELVNRFAVGCISGTIACGMYQPLDVIKTRVQQRSIELLSCPSHIPATPHSLVKGGNKMNHLVLWEVIKDIKKDSLTGFWRGFSPSVLKTSLGLGMHFLFLHHFGNLFLHKNQRLLSQNGAVVSHSMSHNTKSLSGLQASLTPTQNLISGTLARSIAVAAVGPLSLAKARSEANNQFCSQMMSNNRRLWWAKTNMFVGILPTLMRDVPYSALYLWFYTMCKRRIEKRGDELGPGQVMFRSTCASAACAFVVSGLTHPFDLLKTLKQITKDEGKSYVNLAKSIIKKSGVKGLYSGFLPRTFRRTLMTTTSWFIVDNLYLLNAHLLKRKP